MANIFKMMFFIGLLLTELIRAPYRIANKRARQQKRISESRISTGEIILMTLSFLGMMVVPLIYIFSSWLDFADYELPVLAGFIGTAFMVASLAVLWRAHRDLGRNWSPTLEIVQEQKLVTHGIFATIRHPIYLSVWLMMIAQALMLSNWFAGLIGLVTFAPIYFTRVPREEQMMLESFGDEYRQYMEQTGRLLPRLHSGKSPLDVEQ